MCTANVCRSPRAEFVLRQTLSQAPQLAGVGVASAGTDAARAEHICDTARAVGSFPGVSSPTWTEFADRHRSTAISMAKIAHARLILTAGREHRAILATLDPSARAKTFTLREAVWLGQGFRASSTGPAAIDEFAEFANENRGRRELPRPDRRSSPWRRTTTDVLSIGDAHDESPRAHKRAIADVTRVAERVGALITGGGEPPS